MHNPSKVSITGRVVKLLFHRQEDRGMTLIEHGSRCIRKGEIHELVTTDHVDLAAGDRINRVGFIGFAEFLCAGVVERGDNVTIDGVNIGTVCGFDDCHFPNHYNIIIATARCETAASLNVGIEQNITFSPSRLQ
jgi:uncharacterized protein DUF6917